VSTCEYCRLPKTMVDPFSGKPCCRVDYELIAGALDYDKNYLPTAQEILAEYEWVPFTDDEREAWEHIVWQRFGRQCACGAAEVDHRAPSVVSSGCVVSPSTGHKCPCLNFSYAS
jgi:hypothetical protein